MKRLSCSILVAVAALAVGCKSGDTIKKDPTPAPEPTKTGTSGTRLKVRTITADDGAKLQLGLFDSERGAPCSFLPAADGVKRCLPEVPYFTGTYWADPGCKTTPIAVFPKECGAPPLVLKQATPSTCAGDTPNVGVYATEGGVNLSSIYSSNGATCTLQSSGPLSGATLVKLGAEVAASEFVAGDETDE